MNIGEETKAFYEWLRETFDWIDDDAKRLMFKSWCACAKNRDNKVRKR